MIVDLPSTSTSEVTKRLISLREDVGSMALGRVLTLVIPVGEADVDHAVTIAHDASHQHPCRVIALVSGNPRGATRLDAQIRVGGDAGASEIIILRMYGPLARQGRAVATPLLLADSPIVVWWPGASPTDPSADPLGALAQRRITDSARARHPHRRLEELASHYAAGDTDLAWTRVTLWRGRLAAALDQPPYEPVDAVTVVGAGDSPSAYLLAGWLGQALQCPTTITSARSGSGIISVHLERASGAIDMARPAGDSAQLRQPGQPDRAIVLPHRSDAECLADELRRLDPDEVYASALVHGIPTVVVRRPTRRPLG